MDFWTAVQSCFRQYATFQGRARRSEFFYFWLFTVLGSIAAAILDAALGTGTDAGGAVTSLFNLATILPRLAVTARRLHDTGRSGWWQVAYVIPAMGLILGAITVSGVLTLVSGIALLVTAIAVLVWLLRAGDRGPNRFGPDPLGPPVMAYPV